VGVISEFDVSDKVFLDSREKGSELGHIRNSITRGGGNLAGFIGGMTAYGALGVMATDRITKGVTQRDWSKPESIIDAMIGGGAIGLYTDFVLGPYSSNSQFSAWSNVLGPVPGTIANAGELMTGVFNDDPKAKRLLNLIHNVTPAANLFYMRRAFDYMVWWNMQEYIDPGSIQKMERALKKSSGQQHLTNPRVVIPRGGGNPAAILGRILE
jgi:hypothetical protein